MAGRGGEAAGSGEVEGRRADVEEVMIYEFRLASILLKTMTTRAVRCFSSLPQLQRHCSAVLPFSCCYTRALFAGQ